VVIAKPAAAAPAPVVIAKPAAAVPAPVVVAKPAAAAPAPVVIAKPAAAAPAPVVIAKPAATTNGRRQLRLNFSGESWAEVYDAEGSRLYWDLGQGGQGRTVSGIPPFTIILGNPALVSLAYEGKALVLPAPRFGTTLHATLDGNGALAAVR
jgi:cytoskeleton protein RodZ